MRDIAHCTIKPLKRNKNGYQRPKTKENRDNLGQKSRRRDKSNLGKIAANFGRKIMYLQSYCQVRSHKFVN